MTDSHRMQPNRPEETSYAGVGVTFGRVPLVLDPAGLAGADVAVLGAPFDEGVSYRPGTRFGPRAIRTAEDVAFPIDRPHMELGIDPFAELDIVDYGDIEARPVRPGPLAHAAAEGRVARSSPPARCRSCSAATTRCRMPVAAALAGRFGAGRLRGHPLRHARRHGRATRRRGDSHGTPFHLAVATARLRRAQHRPGRAARGLAVARGLRVDAERRLPLAHDGRDRRARHRRRHRTTRSPTPARARRAPTSRSTSTCSTRPSRPAPGTAEPGGLTTRELLWAVRRVASQVDLCAMDIVEVSPPYDPTGITAMAGHRVVLETLSGIALRKSGREARPERP